MGKISRRSRSGNWDDSETILLARLKKEAFYRNEEGGHVWHEISRSISGRSAKQCRERWDTLVKLYNKVQAYCTQTGRTHEDLDDVELASLELSTSFGRAWYNIVQDVCGHRKRKERRHPDREAVTRSEGSTDDSVTTSVDSDLEINTVFQWRETPDISENYDRLVAISIMHPSLEDVRVMEDVTVNTPPEVSNPLDVARDSFVPLTPRPNSDRTSELEKPSLVEENLKPEKEVNALSHQLNAEENNQKLKEEKARLRQMQPPQATQLHEELLEHGKTPFQIVEDAELPEWRGLSDECSDGAQCNGAETGAEGMDYNPDEFDYVQLMNLRMSNLSISKEETLAEGSVSTVSEGTITKESSDNTILEAFDAKSECVDLKAPSKVIELQVIELGVYLCCRGCMRKLKKNIEKVDGVQKVEFKYECDKVIHKVLVTAKAEPEVVLKHAQMAKKKVVLLSPKKLIAPNA